MHKLACNKAVTHVILAALKNKVVAVVIRILLAVKPNQAKRVFI